MQAPESRRLDALQLRYCRVVRHAPGVQLEQLALLRGGHVGRGQVGERLGRTAGSSSVRVSPGDPASMKARARRQGRGNGEDGRETDAGSGHGSGLHVPGVPGMPDARNDGTALLQ